MNEMNSLTFYKSFYDAIEKLDDKQRLEMYDAIMAFQFKGENPNFEDKILDIIWALIQPNIKASNAKKSAGSKGGKSKKAKDEASLEANSSVLASKLESNIEEEVEEEVEEDVKVEVEEEVESAGAEKNVDVFENTNCHEEKDEVFLFYLNNINSAITPWEADTLEHYQKELPSDLIIHAMQEAVNHKARNLKYIASILNRYLQNDITTLAEAEEKEKVSTKDDVWANFRQILAREGAGTSDSR